MRSGYGSGRAANFLYVIRPGDSGHVAESENPKHVQALVVLAKRFPDSFIVVHDAVASSTHYRNCDLQLAVFFVSAPDKSTYCKYCWRLLCAEYRRMKQRTLGEKA